MMTPSELAAALKPFVDRGTLAGAVVLVAARDKVPALEAVGYSDVAAKTPMPTDALFWIASQSKPVTAAALMILVDEGKVKLDDPVAKYIPEQEEHHRKVSFQDEFRRLLGRYGIEFDERYVWD